MIYPPTPTPAYARKFFANADPALKSNSRGRRPVDLVGRCRLLCTLLGLLLVSFCAPATELDSLGWLEWSWLQPQNIRLKTKLDTGAKTSSIDATNIEQFESEGKPWVRFTIPLSKRPEDSDYGGDVTLERPLMKTIKIKDHERAPTARLVVRLGLCIGGKMFDTPVSLTDRSQFNYPFLLGRTALKKRILVDSSKTFTTGRSCTSGS